MNNQQVLQLQKLLNRSGYRDQKGNKLTEDGLLGSKTTYALQTMLHNNGYTGKDGKVITTDGIWGPNTEAAYSKYITRVATNPLALIINRNSEPAVTGSTNKTATDATKNQHQQLQTSLPYPAQQHNAQTVINIENLRAEKDTRTWQSLLNSAGYRDQNGQLLAEDGIWGTNTEYAWQQYQKDKRNQSYAQKTTITRQELDEKIQQTKLEAALKADTEAQKTFATQKQTYNMQSVLNALGFTGLDGQPLRENGVLDLNTLVAWDRLRHSGNTMGNANSPIMQTLNEQRNKSVEQNNISLGLASGAMAANSIKQTLNVQKELNRLGYTDYYGNPLEETGIMNNYTRFALNQKKVVSYIEENADIAYFNNNKAWADLNGLQGIGFDANGDIVYGNPEHKDLAKLIQLMIEYEKPGANQQLIERQIEKIKATHPDYDVVGKEKTLEYYQIIDITDRLNEIMKDAEKQYAIYYYAPDAMKYLTFLLLVAPNMKYDLKSKDEFLAHSLYIYDGEIVDRDVLGNIVYGYLGRVMGINELPLYTVPGLEQIYKNTSDPNWGYSYYDDPRDQARIMQGVDIYDLWH